MGTENDIDAFIQLQKQKLAQERDGIYQHSKSQPENRQTVAF